MSDSLDPRDDLSDRLAALGRQPVAPSLQSEHLTAMASVSSGRSFRTSLVGRLKVGAGVFAGFLFGASGLATVGGLGPLQPIVAERAAEVANVQLPQGPKAKAEKAAKEKAEKAAKARLADGSIGTQRDWSDNCVPGDDGKFAGNRGQYLKQIRDDGGDLAAAKASTCGKPIGGGDEAEGAEVEEPKKTETEDEGAENGKSDEAEGKKDAAPGQADKDEKAKGPKDADADADADADDDADEADDDADEADDETPSAETGKSGVTPPVTDPPADPAPKTPDHTTADA